jgi:hypothetical protein
MAREEAPAPEPKKLMTASGIEVIKRDVPKAKMQVGAANQPVGYNPGETVIHISSIPPEKLQDKRNAKKEARGDKIGMKQNKWNISVEDPNKLCVRRMRVIPDHDRPNMHQYNYRAEVLPPSNPHFEKAPKKMEVQGVLSGGDPSTTFSYSSYGESHNPPPEASMVGADERVLMSQVSKRTAEMTINPKLGGKTWNHSTYVEKYHVQHRIKMDEEARVRNSKNSINKLNGYKTPEQRAKEERERLRLVKAGKSISGGPESTHAEEDYSRIPKPRNRYAVEANRKYKKTAHSGVWEFNKVMQKYVWSDTMSEVKDSPGDVTYVKNPDGWNYAAPN